MAYVGRTTLSRGIDSLRRTTPAGSSNRAALSSPASLRDHVLISRPVRARFNITDFFRRPTVAIATATVGTIGTTAAMLAPSIALAGDGAAATGILTTLAQHPGLVGGLAVVGLATLIAAHKIYFNPDSRYGAKPGDPTPRRILRKFILPTFSALAVAGMGLAAVWVTAPVVGIPTGYLALTLVGGAFAYASIRSAISIGKEIRQRLSGINPRLEQYSLKNRVTTTLLNRFASFGDHLFIGYLSMVTGQIMFGALGNMTMNMRDLIFLGQQNFSNAGPLLGLGVGLIFNLWYRRTVSKLVNPLNHPQKIRWSAWYVAKDIAIGAAIGTLAGAMGLSYGFNLLLAVVFLMGMAHGVLHSTRSQANAHIVEESPEHEFSQEAINSASFVPDAPFMTVLKPAFSGEVFLPLWPMIFCRQQTNWLVNQPNGNNMFARNPKGEYKAHGAYTGAHAVYARLRGANTEVRKVLVAAQERVNTATSKREAINAMIALSNEMARITDEASEGIVPNAQRSIDRMTGLVPHTATPPGTFISGPHQNPGHGCFEDPVKVEDSGRTWENEHTRYLARIMRTWATFYRREATRLASYQNDPAVTYIKLADVQKEMSHFLECEARRHNVPFQLLPFMLWENVYPDLDLTKIEKSDKVFGFIRDFKRAMSIIRQDRETGRFYMELLPTRMAKVVRANQGGIRNIESGPNEDNRFEWIKQREEDIGDTHSDIAWIDDTRLHSEHPERFPTGDIHEGPHMEATDCHDFVFQDGSIQRISGDGNIVYVNAPAGSLAKNADPIIWFPGGPEPMAGDLTPSSPRGTRHYNDVPDYEWFRLDCFKPQVYFFAETPFVEVCDKEQANFLTPEYLADFVKDDEMNYLKLDWRIPEKVRTAYDPQMRDSKHDQLVQVAQAVSWFVLRVQEDNERGRTLYFPYNVRKDGITFWSDIDESRGLSLVNMSTDPGCPSPNRPYLRATFKDGSPVYLKSTAYLGNPSDYVDARVYIDMGRGKVSPLSMAKYTFLRRNENGKIVVNGKEVSDQEWKVLIQKTPHPGWSGGYALWRYQRRRIMEQTLYERFQPLEAFMEYHDPATID